MKTTILTVINLVLVIALGILLSRFLGQNQKNQIPVTDTVFIDRVLKPETQYKEVEVPKTVYQYRVDTVEISKVELKSDTVTIYLQDSLTLEVSSQFLTQYPTTDRLIQLLVDSKTLNLSLQNTSGKVFTKTYEVDFQNHSYNYLENTLTSKPKPIIRRFSPYTELQFRPIHNLWDFNLGLKYETKLFNYEIGFNAFYYPEFKKNLGTDLYLKLNYTF